MWWHATLNLDDYTAFVSTFTQEHLFASNWEVCGQDRLFDGCNTKDLQKGGTLWSPSMNPPVDVLAVCEL
jgi:hypothetical protein